MAQAISSYFRINLFGYVTENAIANLRRDVYSRLIKLPIPYFSEKRVGELNSRVSADISTVKDTLTSVIAEFIREVITIVGSAVLLVLASWQLVAFYGRPVARYGCVRYLFRAADSANSPKRRSRPWRRAIPLWRKPCRALPP